MDRYLDFNPSLARHSCQTCEESPPPPYQLHRKPTEATVLPSYSQATQYFTDVPHDQASVQIQKKGGDGLLRRCWKRLAPTDATRSNTPHLQRYRNHNVSPYSLNPLTLPTRLHQQGTQVTSSGYMLVGPVYEATPVNSEYSSV